MARSTLRNVLLGLGVGAFVATGFSVWVTIIRLSAGPEVFDRPGGTSYPRIVLYYYVGFAVSGLLIGAFAPLRRWALGSMLLGFLFMMPMYACFFLLPLPRSEWMSSGNLGVMLIISALAGGALGLWVWWDDQRKR